MTKAEKKEIEQAALDKYTAVIYPAWAEYIDTSSAVARSSDNCYHSTEAAAWAKYLSLQEPAGAEYDRTVSQILEEE
jgi:uncharacterized lipoprotein YmbA